MDAKQVLPQGSVLENRYRIVAILGQGGMSRVYLAQDLRLGMQVAVKENLQTDTEAREQFESEARLLAAMSHPNLPRVIDHFTDAQTWRQYLVMDFVQGQNLEELVELHGPLSEETALAWTRQVLFALEYLHARKPSVIHRDIKPANIKITPQGKAFLVDFGIAKIYNPKQGTLTGARALTAGYAPPEQYGMHTDERSDIYALGATLFTMLTGLVPPEAPLRIASKGALISIDQRLQGKATSGTRYLVTRAMELEANKRWQSAAQMRAALEKKSTAPVPTPIPNTDARMLIAAGIIGAAVLVVILLAFLITRNPTNPNPPSTTNVPVANSTRPNETASISFTLTPRATPNTLQATRTLAPLVVSTGIATAILTDTQTPTATVTNTPRKPTLTPSATWTPTEIPTVITDTPVPTVKEREEKPTKDPNPPPTDKPAPTEKPTKCVPSPSNPC